MDLHTLALHVQPWQKTLKKQVPHGVVFIGHNMRFYWHLETQSNTIRQISFADACTLVLGERMAPCFHFAKWHKAFEYCFLIPCRMLLPDTYIDIPLDHMSRRDISIKSCIFSTVVSSGSLETPPPYPTWFYARRPKSWDFADIPLSEIPRTRRIDRI